MDLRRYLYVPYRAVRVPLAAVDARLPQRSPVRRLTATALHVTDGLAERLFHESSARSAAVDRDEPTEPTQPTEPTEPDETDEAAPLDDEREADLTAARKRREHSAGRANKNLSTISRDVRRAQAVADVHEARAQDAAQEET